jgi:hypothetical protein
MSNIIRTKKSLYLSIDIRLTFTVRCPSIAGLYMHTIDFLHVVCQLHVLHELCPSVFFFFFLQSIKKPSTVILTRPRSSDNHHQLHLLIDVSQWRRRMKSLSVIARKAHERNVRIDDGDKSSAVNHRQIFFFFVFFTLIDILFPYSLK